jgi:hypothetical protein
MLRADDGAPFSPNNTNNGITGPPALAVYNDELFCVHEGAGQSGKLYYFLFSGTKGIWEPDQVVPIGDTVAGSDRHNFPTVALAAFQGSLHCVFEGGTKRGGGQLWHIVFNSGEWGPAQRIGTFGSSGGPGLAVINGALFCFHEGAYQDGQIWLTTFDGTNWSADKKVNLSTSGPPGLAVAHLSVPSARDLSTQSGPQPVFDVSFWIWEGSRQDGTAHTVNNTTLTDQQIANMTLDGPPGMAVFGNTLLAAYATPTGELHVREAPIARPPAETFNLMLPQGRQTAPYASLPSYTTDLQNQSPYNSLQYPVRVIRHHVIPYNLLVNFWNTLVAQGQLGQGSGPADGLLNAMASTLNDYAVTMHPTDRANLIALLQGMRDGTIRHAPGGPTHNEIDNLAALYQWLPGNLFIGPQNRSDDPGDAFETGAGVVVGGGNFDRYVTADQAIRTYLNAPTTVAGANAARQAGSNLGQIASVKSMFALNPDNWVRNNNGSYKLASIEQMERVARAIMAPAAG